HGSGDRVMAENYLQHAEHYNRIIAAAQAQLQVQVQRDYRDEYDDDEEQDSGSTPVSDRKPSDGSGPQPVISGVPAEVVLNEEMPASAEKSEEKAEPKSDQPKAPRRARRPRKAAKPAEAGDDVANDSPVAAD